MKRIHVYACVERKKVRIQRENAEAMEKKKNVCSLLLLLFLLHPNGGILSRFWTEIYVYGNWRLNVGNSRWVMNNWEIS